jgi:DNA polymerase
MLVGEQPGDAEDRAGLPFVGPAGQLLTHVLTEVWIDPARVYLTNVVKHFKWEPRGKRRIHKQPHQEEIQACRVWLDAEIDLVKPHAIVALGATAAHAVIGPAVRISRDRGKFFQSSLAPFVAVTVHPSSVLRAPDSAARTEARARFVDDLRKILASLADR